MRPKSTEERTVILRYDSAKFTLRDNLEIQRRLNEFTATLWANLPDTLTEKILEMNTKFDLEKGYRR